MDKFLSRAGVEGQLVVFSPLYSQYSQTWSTEPFVKGEAASETWGQPHTGHRDLFACCVQSLISHIQVGHKSTLQLKLTLNL